MVTHRDGHRYRLRDTVDLPVHGYETDAGRVRERDVQASDGFDDGAAFRAVVEHRARRRSKSWRSRAGFPAANLRQIVARATLQLPR